MSTVTGELLAHPWSLMARQEASYLTRPRLPRLLQLQIRQKAKIRASEVKAGENKTSPRGHHLQERRQQEQEEDRAEYHQPPHSDQLRDTQEHEPEQERPQVSKPQQRHPRVDENLKKQKSAQQEPTKLSHRFKKLKVEGPNHASERPTSESDVALSRSKSDEDSIERKSGAETEECEKKQGQGSNRGSGRSAGSRSSSSTDSSGKRRNDRRNSAPVKYTQVLKAGELMDKENKGKDKRSHKRRRRKTRDLREEQVCSRVCSFLRIYRRKR